MGFIVVYDEGNDYVIALEMFDNMFEVNTIQESLNVDDMNSCAKSKFGCKGFVHMDGNLLIVWLMTWVNMI